VTEEAAGPISPGPPDVLEIHTDQIERYGGAVDIRDQGLMLSAIAQPCAAFGGHFLHDDLFLMAAAYLFHLVQNHPFVDGNKRTGTASALVFLDLNGFEVDCDADALAELVIDVTLGKSGQTEVADFFRRHAVPRAE
jgi:death-on-curing protein